VQTSLVMMEGSGVGVDVGTGVDVEVGVIVGIGVIVGPNRPPGPQPETIKLKIRKQMVGMAFFMVFSFDLPVDQVSSQLQDLTLGRKVRHFLSTVDNADLR